MAEAELRAEDVDDVDVVDNVDNMDNNVANDVTDDVQPPIVDEDARVQIILENVADVLYF